MGIFSKPKLPKTKLITDVQEEEVEKIRELKAEKILSKKAKRVTDKLLSNLEEMNSMREKLVKLHVSGVATAGTYKRGRGPTGGDFPGIARSEQRYFTEEIFRPQEEI